MEEYRLSVTGYIKNSSEAVYCLQNCHNSHNPYTLVNPGSVCSGESQKCRPFKAASVFMQTESMVIS